MPLDGKFDISGCKWHFLFVFEGEANTSVIDVNDLNLGNVRDAETKGNDIIVSSSNNKQYSPLVLSVGKTETKTGWKHKLSYSFFSLALQKLHSSFQFLQVVLMESHIAVFLSLWFCRLILSLFCLYPCLTVSVSLSAGMHPFYIRGVSTKTMTARRLGWWNHMLMHFLCCLTVTRARIPNGDLHLISNFNLALEYAEALCFVVLYNFLCFTLWELDIISVKAEGIRRQKKWGNRRSYFLNCGKKPASTRQW